LVIQRLTYVGKSGTEPPLAAFVRNRFGPVIRIRYGSIGKIYRTPRNAR
jgi:hypothetical protein